MSKIWSTVVRKNAGKSGEDVDSLIASSEADKLHNTITKYNALFKESTDTMGNDAQKIKEREHKYMDMVNAYYDLATDFYEYGWGQSFHFAPRYDGESFAASIARHEHYLALRIGLKAGMKCMDIGCGVGGPMREIARLSHASIYGVNNNAYQVQRSDILNKRCGLQGICNTVRSDFMNLPFAPNSMDGAYAMEATCHAPDKAACFAQIYKALKPGAYFAGFDWVMTDKYDPTNAEHNKIKHDIEHGDSLPNLPKWTAVDEALVKAGFEVVDSFDMAVEAKKNGQTVGWHETLKGGMTFAQIKHSRLGRMFTQRMVDVMEFLRVAPKGTSETHKMLCTAADALARGGDTGIFTPMYFFLGRKPLDAKTKA